MADISVTKKDLFWSYLAQILSMGAGIVTLPFILSKLSTNEIGVNYILLTVGSVIALVDLGFAPQFARNFTYVFSGVQELRKFGVAKTREEVNYHLLSSLLKTARYIYAVLAAIALILLLVIGTPYIYKTTSGFTAIPNALATWIVYCFGVLFQVFYSYYFSMLLGAGKIKEQKYAIIGNKLIYIGILIFTLYLGWGLLSVALAQLISPFFGRVLSYNYFYDKDLKKRLREHQDITKEEILAIFKTLWYNAKRTATMHVGAYAILRFSMFIAGLYLSIEEFASYGLMVQLVGFMGAVSCTFMQISQPGFASLRAKGDDIKLLQDFSKALWVYYVLFIGGSIVFVLFGQNLMQLIKSNANLPNTIVLLIYSIVMFLENNQANFAILISSNNNVPFAPASIITGCAVCFGTFIVLSYTSLGILGIVIVQGACQMAYQNWKWPMVALKELKISYFKLLSLNFTATTQEK